MIAIVEETLFESTDVVMVNSKFTASQFKRVMPGIPSEKIRVVYPPCDVDSIVIQVVIMIRSTKKIPKFITPNNLTLIKRTINSNVTQLRLAKSFQQM